MLPTEHILMENGLAIMLYSDWYITVSDNIYFLIYMGIIR